MFVVVFCLFIIRLVLWWHCFDLSDLDWFHDGFWGCQKGEEDHHKFIAGKQAILGSPNEEEAEDYHHEWYRTKSVIILILAFKQGCLSIRLSDFVGMRIIAYFLFIYLLIVIFTICFVFFTGCCPWGCCSCCVWLLRLPSSSGFSTIYVAGVEATSHINRKS